MRTMTSMFRASAFATLLALPAAAGAESATVEIAAPDSVKLAATHTSPGKPGPGVLLLHMCISDRSAWTGLAGKLAAHGIHSLALDYRGFGDSGGEPRADFSREAQSEVWPGDIDAAFEFLRSLPGVDKARIGVGGASCGVYQAVELARRHPGEVTTLVLLAGGIDQGGMTFLAQNPWLPILGSASLDDDEAVEGLRWTMGYSSHPSNRFLEYSHGGHGTEMFAVHADLEPEIAGWFRRYLIEEPVRMPDEVIAEPGPSYRLWQEFTAPGALERLARQLRASPGARPPLPPEEAINAEGYRLLAAGETKKAIEVLVFNVEAFPRSANALDSLGDAYLADGQVQKAAEMARRTIEALPNDPNKNENRARALRAAAERKLETAGHGAMD